MNKKTIFLKHFEGFYRFQAHIQGVCGEIQELDQWLPTSPQGWPCSRLTIRNNKNFEVHTIFHLSYQSHRFFF